MDHDLLYRFLSHQRYGVVSSVGADGTPQSALVGIAVTSTLEIVFDTAKESRKYKNFESRPDCSFVIGWADEKTVQLEGSVRIPSGAELNEIRRIYCSVWPEGELRLSSPNIALLIARPRWIRYSDYSASPVRIDEIRLES